MRRLLHKQSCAIQYVKQGNEWKYHEDNAVMFDYLVVKLSTIKQNKQDRQALLEAKYCPRVAAVSCTQRNTKNNVTLTFDLEIQ